MHRDTIETLLIALCKAGLASYLGGSGQSASADQQQSRCQEFWFNVVGREVVAIAAEYQCGEAANQVLYSAVSAYSGNPCQGPASLDMRIFLDRVVGPVSADIARLV